MRASEFVSGYWIAIQAFPVIFLTSRTDEIDQIFGLRLGAWDYLTKPISTALLAEKVAFSSEQPARNGMDTVLTDGSDC